MIGNKQNSTPAATNRPRWFSLARHCLSCSGRVPLSELNHRGRGNLGYCVSCGMGHRFSGSRFKQAVRFLGLGAPLIMLALFGVGAFIEILMPALVYETETGLRKLRGAAFPFFALTLFAAGFLYWKTHPLERVDA